MRDLLSERDINVAAATVERWAKNFGSEIEVSRMASIVDGAGLNGTWMKPKCEWTVVLPVALLGTAITMFKEGVRAVDQIGQLIDFRLIARRTSGAARAV